MASPETSPFETADARRGGLPHDPAFGRIPLIYLGTFMALEWAVQVALIVATGPFPDGAANDSQAPVLLVCMLIPLLVLLGFCAARQVRLGELGLRPLKWRYWLVGFGVALLAQAVVFAASLWAIDYPAFSAAGGQWKLEGMSTLFGQPNPPLLFVANTLLTMVVATLLTVPQALGEEAAWRGYLQPKFISRFGPVRGIALLGVVWGLFHLPICLAGYNFPASPILGGFVFMIGGTIGLGGLFGWLRLKSGSVWPAAVGHAAWNISCSVTYFAVPRIDVTAYYALQTAVILAVGGVFWWLLAREATAGQAEPS